MFSINPPVSHTQNYREEFIMFYFLEKNIIASQLQIERIKNDRKNFRKQIKFTIKNYNRPNSWTKYLAYLFIDIHFFLIALSNIGKNLEKLKKVRSYDSDFVSICKKYIKQIQKIDDFRDNLEHIAERLRGKDKKGNDLKNPSDLGNLSGDNFTFGGELLDLKHSTKLIDDLSQDITSWQLSKKLA